MNWFTVLIQCISDSDNSSSKYKKWLETPIVSTDSRIFSIQLSHFFLSYQTIFPSFIMFVYFIPTYQYLFTSLLVRQFEMKSNNSAGLKSLDSTDEALSSFGDDAALRSHHMETRTVVCCSAISSRTL